MHWHCNNFDCNFNSYVHLLSWNTFLEYVPESITYICIVDLHFCAGFSEIIYLLVLPFKNTPRIAMQNGFVLPRYDPQSWPDVTIHITVHCVWKSVLPPESSYIHKRINELYVNPFKVMFFCRNVVENDSSMICLHWAQKLNEFKHLDKSTSYF